MDRDRSWIEKTMNGEYDLLMEPGENRFRSLRWDLNDLNPSDVTCGNWGIWAFRGKRYGCYFFPCRLSLANILCFYRYETTMKDVE